MNLIDELNKCTTIEDVIKIGWLLRAQGGFSQTELKEKLEQKKEEIRRKELLTYQDKVLFSLFKELEEPKEEDPIAIVSTITKLPEWKIFDILQLFNYENNLISSLSALYQEAKEKDLCFEEAKIVVNLYIKMKPQERKLFFQKTKCSISEFEKALDCVKEDEIYQQYLVAKEEAKKERLMELSYPNSPIPTQKDRLNRLAFASKEQLYQYFSTLEKKSYTRLFCDMIGIIPSVFEIIWAKDKEYAMVLLSMSKEEQKQAMKKYQENLKEKLLESINEMYQILIMEKNGQEKVPMFDVYTFYKNGFDINLSYSLLNLSNDKKARTILSQFEKYHHNYFESYKERELNAYRHFGRMTLGNQSVVFTSHQFNQVVKKIEEEQLPNKKGLLLQLLKLEKEKEVRKKVYQKM